ncbi:pilus assembly protein [Sphingomonas sp. PL-96]|uniref:TadE/TadG family type IV pilus assembly protein n=1 Tax=Sphingomonas sp. PL-96 TaxID=2887201 RepID=UPI001E2E7A4F|nr:TadE/TadG family type IV pilus assembly protein [Sphingomonas sp. PL-96]MCC2975072.1 pilus assembly protein [Sphingomonas sp. PL-96]
MIRAFLRSRRGASAVEFALVAPVLLAFILLLIEGGRMLWTQQALQEVASATARCLALGAEGCETPAAAAQFARARGPARGISLVGATITPRLNQTCNGTAGMAQVAIVLPFQVAGGLLPGGPSELDASACYPALS